MRNKLIQALSFFYLLLSVACTDKEAKNEPTEIIDISRCSFDFDLSTAIDSISYIQLNDSAQEAIFATIDKCQVYDGKIFILDFDGTRSVKVFDLSGNYLFTPGKVGKGPGEYVRIYDFDVNRNGIYLLDRNTEKIIRFSHTGQLIREYSFSGSPDKVNGFAVTDDGNFLIGTDKGEVKKGNKLILADTAFHVLRSFDVFEPFDTEGELKLDMFKRCGKIVAFHYPVCDDVYVFDTQGTLLKKLNIRLSARSIPDELRADFEKLEENSEPYTYFYNTPFVTERFILSVLSHKSSESLFYVDRRQEKYVLCPFQKGEKYDIHTYMEPVFATEYLIMGCLDYHSYERTKGLSFPAERIKYLEDGGNLLILYHLAHESKRSAE